MDYIEFYIPTKALSGNHTKYKNGFKKTETRVYETFIETFLRCNSKHAKIFGDSFDRSRHFIEAKYYFCNEAERFFTKAGYVSLTAMDTDNCIKVVQDKVFKFIGINDGTICISTQYKVPFKINAIVITLKLRDLERVEDILPDDIREKLMDIKH